MIDPEFMNEARVAAVQRLGKVLASQRGRQWMKQNGYSSGMQIVAAHESEAMVDVLDRIEAHGGAPVVLAVHYPHREGDEELRMGLWHGRSEGSECLSARVRVRFPNAAAGQDSRIGMVIDAAHASSDQRKFNLDLDHFAKDLSFFVRGGTEWCCLRSV